ncbi:MAG: hypothetical protein IK010_01205 [Bacteroidales bacterium]|nr:hypothetical protein [Bacteroidales bacterium]
MKHFLVILGLTALVWLGVSMSENDEYPMRVRVEMTGYDTVRYAVLQADTALDLQVRMSGFNAMLHSLHHHVPNVKVQLSDGQEAVAVHSIDEQLRASILGAKQVSSEKDTLRILLAERSHRDYHPRIDRVNFSFVEQYGLYGEPVVTPSTVVLYGPEEVLASIPELHAVPTELYNIKSTGTFRIPLEPVWEQYVDVHPSCKEVEVYLPVEPYVEKVYNVPITVENADSTVDLRLYPQQAKVRVWVAQRDLAHEPEFTVSINYREVLAHEGRVAPHLSQFPSYVRLRNVEPQEVQCVVIK